MALEGMPSPGFPQLGSTDPTFSTVLNHGGEGEKRGGGTDLPKSQNRQGVTYPEQAEPPTPATLLMRTGSLVSMTEPRSHEGA